MPVRKPSAIISPAASRPLQRGSPSGAPSSAMVITPEPHKRPKASFTRFEAQLPNELWQTDATEWHLADSSKVEILNLIDDHSRLCLGSVAVPTVKAADAVECFYLAAEEFGLPARFPSDNA